MVQERKKKQEEAAGLPKPMAEKQTVTVTVANKKVEVQQNKQFRQVLDELVAAHGLGRFTIRIDDKDVTEEEDLPNLMTMELDSRIQLIPYDRAAR